MGTSSDEFPLLAAHGLYVADTAGNGNCLFNALSDQIYGTQTSHHDIRSRVIDYMREHADLYKSFVDVYPGGGVRRNPKRKNAGAYATPINYTPPTQAEIDRVFESHLQQMAKGGTYGDNMEIVAFSAAFGVNVKIYQRDFAYMVTGDGQEDSGKNVAHVAYHTWEHYSSIRNIKGPHTGLPCVNPAFVSPEAEREHKDKLAKTTYVLPWMVNVVVQSLPYLADPATIHKTLEECKGNIDVAVSKLLDAEERASTSSAQDSSSVEREPDSDDESYSGPNKKQDRRLSRATRNMMKDEAEQKKRALALRLKVQASNSSSHRPLSSLPNEVYGNDLKEEDADETEEEDWQNDPSYKDSESASDFSTASRPRSGGVRLRLSQPKRESDKDPPTQEQHHHTNGATTNGIQRTQQRQPGPKQKRQTQRDKRDMKKAAQKAAAKERKQGVASRKVVNGRLGVSPLGATNKENSPAIESGITGIKTLYI